MPFLHETHHVRPSEAAAFEAVFRREWLSRLADGGDARVLWYTEQALPGGPPNHVVTITAVRDGAAWERLVVAIHEGELAIAWRSVGASRESVTTKVLLPTYWSPFVSVDFASVPRDDAEHEPTFYLEDTMWPHDGKLLDYVDAAGSVYVERGPKLLDPAHTRDWRADTAAVEEGLIKIEAAFQPALGSHRRKEVMLWQPIYNLERLQWFLVNELPPEDEEEDSWMQYALRVRDRYQSRLLRTAAWSPYF